jgi:hypothetical protein
MKVFESSTSSGCPRGYLGSHLDGKCTFENILPGRPFQKLCADPTRVHGAQISTGNCAS